MKSKLYKSLLCSVVGAGMLSLGSCTDLSETIYSQIATEQYEFTEDDAAAMFAPVYSSLRNVYWAWNGYADVMDETSDLWTTPLRIGVGWGDLYIAMHEHNFHSQIDHLWTEWQYAYEGINACNKLLDQDVVKESETTTSQLRAYRALYYYILFDLFRNIPLDTTYDHPAGWQPEQATPQETWDFLITELNDIKDKCGNEVRMGEINNYAVHMILAKMYLNHNAWFNDHSDNTYYQKCIDELEYVLAGPFSLAPNYLDNFKEDISTSPEIIFGIPFEYLYAAGNYYANKWMNEAGRATWGFTGWATGGSAALPQFLDTYDPDDSRFDDCWIGEQQYDMEGNAIYVDGQPLVYTKEIRSTDNPGCYPMEGYRLVKYEIKTGDWGTSYDDVPFFRLADAMMMKAECLLRLGGYKEWTEQDAADLVTEVRRRAFQYTDPDKAVRTVAELKGGSVYEYGHRENTAKQDEPDNWVTTEEGGDDIELGGLLDDLAWEFVAEHHRRQDLIRFRMTNGQNVFNGKSWFCKDRKTDINDNHCDIFPIHKTFLEGNLKLKQNPGYGG